MKSLSILMSFVLATLMLPPNCIGMDADSIRALAKKPHSRDGLLEELRIFPDAREYEMTVRSGKPSEKLVDTPKITVAEKVVEGKYFVSEFQPPGIQSPIVMVVTFDTKAQVYRKWSLLPDGNLFESIGTAVPKSRMLSWISRSPQKETRQQVLASEIHTDEGVKWREIHLDSDEVTAIVEGTAIKTK